MPQIATFFLGDETFGIDILMTKEIGKIQEITRVPEAPDYILGLMNLRGQIVTLMDPGAFLDQNSAVDPSTRRLIILKTEEELEELRRHNLVSGNRVSQDILALVIDRVGDVLEVDNAKITPPPSNLSAGKKEFVTGVIQLEKKLVILLDVVALAQKCTQQTKIN